MPQPAVSYQVEGMGAGVGRHSAESATGARVPVALDGHGLGAGMLGTFPAVVAFHVTLVHVLARQSAGAGAEAARRSDLAGRAGRVSRLGAGLVDDSGSAASAVTQSAGVAARA
jgi:uncharacterized membrane protein